MWIKFSKLFYVLLVLYYGWFQIVFFQIPNMLLILGAGMVSFIILHALQTRINIFKSITIELKLWILFAITSFIFGLLVAINYQYFISSISNFSQFLVLIFGIVYISSQDKGIDFFIKTMIMLSVICAITTVFWGVNLNNGRISMTLNYNPNLLAITMVIGVCSILYILNFKKLAHSVSEFSAILLFSYVILLTGSRKSFLSVVLIIIYWFIFVALKDIKVLKFKEKMKGIISILLLVVAVYYTLYPFFKDSVMLKRLTVLFVSGAATRVERYIEAFDFFNKSPLVGIGFNNFRALSIYKEYSHSVYAEALACTGLIGSILYFSSYIIILINYIKMINSKKIDVLLQKQAKLLFGLFGVLLFLGIGIIHFYSITSSIAFGMLIAFYNVNKSVLKEERISNDTKIISKEDIVRNN